MKKVLITGVTGFAGSHLAELLVEQGNCDIVGLHVSDRNLHNIANIADKIQREKINLLDREATDAVIQKVQPDIIFHLAASATVKESFEHAADFITNNSTSQINLFEALRKHNLFQTKFVLISSANVYGIVKPADIPIDEQTPFTPDNPYAVSKITQDYLGLCYYLSYKLPIIRLRPFNHVGPRMSADLSVSRFAKYIAEVEKGLQEPILRVGNLDAKRDFTDVRDMVRAYVLASERCENGAYNIGTGVSYTIGEVLDELLELAKVKIDVQVDQSLFRPSDIPELRADATKFQETTGWQPEISLGKMLEDLLEYWRKID
ncbi:MAG TPA: GDP-mannose 4,6-dehydratase [Patescibacteria group bacterium]|nr:GDP-mannose 4,6-dehydratase [Patescibacteria group bacterium]